jgi:hypothetical protein
MKPSTTPDWVAAGLLVLVILGTLLVWVLFTVFMIWLVGALT